MELISHFLAPLAFNIFLFWLFHDFGEYPEPLPYLNNSRKNYTEILIYSLLLMTYFTIKLLILVPFMNSLFISLCCNTIILLLIPLLYVHFRDGWISYDFGCTSKIHSKELLWFGIIMYSMYGFYNTFGIIITWYNLLFLFYSNVFLEEFLFRGIIQSKLERASGQVKSVIYQAILFMLIHIPAKYSIYLSTGDVLRLFSDLLMQFLNGINFGLIYLKTRNIWVSVICHYLYNYVGAIITLFLL